jgi:PAS domain S-box-containing protein
MKTLYETLLEALNKANEDFFIAEGKRILYAKDACFRISGYGSAELSALSSPYELVVPEDRGLVFGGWPPDAQRMVKSHETAIIHKSGRRVDVEVAVKPLRGDDVRSVIILRDITERKRAEKKGRFQAHLLEAVGRALTATDLRGANYLLEPLCRDALRLVLRRGRWPSRRGDFGFRGTAGAGGRDHGRVESREELVR